MFKLNLQEKMDFFSWRRNGKVQQRKQPKYKYGVSDITGQLELQIIQCCQSEKEKIEIGEGGGRHSCGGGQKPTCRKLPVPRQLSLFQFCRQSGTVRRFLAEKEIDCSFRSLSGCEESTFEESEFQGRETSLEVAAAVQTRCDYGSDSGRVS